MEKERREEKKVRAEKYATTFFLSEQTQSCEKKENGKNIYKPSHIIVFKTSISILIFPPSKKKENRNNKKIHIVFLRLQ